jgi:hypothetical protein
MGRGAEIGYVNHDDMRVMMIGSGFRNQMNID